MNDLSDMPRNQKNLLRFLYCFAVPQTVTWYFTLLLRARYFAGKTTANIALHVEPGRVLDFPASQHARIVRNAWQWLTIFDSSG